ncbi:MAG TPA: type II toxin-antitoxin system death-on-curing family toxin [Planctomycetota bacterium]|nr:type II toxin-antitoxin system death-on-curing family toxin [Planctomycetota bacterium]
MSDLVFLTSDDVIAIHEMLIERYGGSAGLRDRDLLDSAVTMPQAAFGGQFVHADVFEMAAAYLFHISRNHAFVDGNKRTAAVAALDFLDLNGYVLKASGRAYEELIVDVAQGKTAKSTAAEFFRKHARPA